MSEDGGIAELLASARRLAARGEDEAAKAAYFDLVRRDPTHGPALNELGALAYASGHRSAARTAYAQAVRHHPHAPVGRVNLGNMLREEGDLAAAREHYAAALAAAPDFAEAHQGMARVLAELGDDRAAAPHWDKGFAGHALVTRRYRGAAPGVPILLLVSAKGGNIPTRHLLDDRVFAISALYAEYHDPAEPLPPHALIFNAIGDADLCAEGLARAEELVRRSAAPVINPPALVAKTGRAANARRLSGIPHAVVPAIRVLPRAALAEASDLRFPLLLRSPGFHTGRHFVAVARPEDLVAAAAQLPRDEVLAIDYLDARGRDGMARKYRVMIIDGVLYPLHLAISADWKVHYFTAAMAGNTGYREEERRFLEEMPAVLGAPAMAALQRIAEIMGLDYAGVDFGLAPDGSLLLFEANPAMVVNRPEPDPIWEYRRAPIERALGAVERMLLARAGR